MDHADAYSYKHMVVRTDMALNMLCFTDTGQAAVYNDAAPAEVFAQKLRDRFPGCTFAVLSFQVL